MVDGTTTSYGYDNANRLTSVNGHTYTWDDNGNLLNDGAQTYLYDQANRLKQATQGAITTTFAYNGAGDRLQQTVNGSPTRYVLDPAAGLTQVLADGTNTYLYGNARLGQYQTAMQYFGADGLGSVRQIYDASALVVGSTRYDPYGSVLAQSGAASVFGYTGEQWDAATGLTYLRARYYSAAQGRFTTRDVWEGDPNAPMSYNAWLYTSGNPINLTDASGHDPYWCNEQEQINPTKCWQKYLSQLLRTLPAAVVAGATPTCTATPTRITTPTRIVTPSGRPTRTPTGTPAPTLPGGLEEEARAVARMLYAEQRSETVTIWEAAAWVVRNRVDQKYYGRTTYKANIETTEFAKISEKETAALTGADKALFNRQLGLARAVVQGSSENPLWGVLDAIFFTNTLTKYSARDAAYVAKLNDPAGVVGPGNWGYLDGPTSWFYYYRNKAGVTPPTYVPLPP